MQPDFNIAVIGGGLAGLSFAIQAAGAGYKVVLFEKEQYPFHKVCGEYISFESYDYLQALGLPLNEMKLPVIKQLQVSSINGRIYNFTLDLGGFGISRYTIDNLLYRLAVQKGVTVYTNEKVNEVCFENNRHVIQSNKRNTTAQVVVAAYGKRSNIDVKWKRSFVERKPGKLDNYIGVKYHIQTNHPLNTVSLHNFRDGYCGISAIEEGRFCLCYLTNAENLASNKNSIQQMEENVLYKNPVLKKIFTGSGFLYDAPLAISQISFERKTQVENHVLMLGDAAGLITPLCGNGMSMAMHSAKLAFAATDNFLQGNRSRAAMEKTYQATWKSNFASRLIAGRMVQRFMGNGMSTSLFLQLTRALPFLSAPLIRATHGKTF